MIGRQPLAEMAAEAAAGLRALGFSAGVGPDDNSVVLPPAAAKGILLRLQRLQEEVDRLDGALRRPPY
jgi:hypothetical protein